MSRLTLLLIACLLLAACGGGEGSGPGGGRDKSYSATVFTQEKAIDEPAPTPLPEPTPEGEQPPVVVTQPVGFAVVAKSFVLAGSAAVHEGTVAWAILGSDLRPIVSGTTTATCGAPCRGTFRTRVPLAKVPLGSYELHVWSPNVADEGPERLHDTMTPITVAARIDPDAPAADAPPPSN